MRGIKKLLLLTQIKGNLTVSIILNVALISYILFGFYGFSVLVIAVPLARIIEEKMGYSYYQDAKDGERK